MLSVDFQAAVNDLDELLGDHAIVEVADNVGARSLAKPGAHRRIVHEGEKEASDIGHTGTIVDGARGLEDDVMPVLEA